VPVAITFAMKEGSKQYHLFATEPVKINRTSTPEETEKGIIFFLDYYIAEVEKILKRYPEQWFNYYDFWK